MIKFIDINTRHTYNGDKPYVHWFDGQQSTGLIYTKNLYILSDKASLNISIPQNDIFHLLDITNMEEVIIDGFDYKDITKMYKNNLTLTGVAYDSTHYIYVVYLACSSSMALEAREDVTIDNAAYTIGADFFAEREELKINIANQGCEIPETIQRAIYDSDVHEEMMDNILLNRKYKELMMNFIDIVGNKGSYKSLLNSLNWFEYGDLLKLHEFWKHTEWGRVIYNDQDFCQVLRDKMDNILVNFSKTTYMGIYCAMERETGNLDPIEILDHQEQFLPEPIPELEMIIFKWSINEMALKMTLLGNFFETYFMPIHTDLIHSTLEDIVYTDSVKLIPGGQMRREDYVIHNIPVICNVKDGDCFVLENAETRVEPDTHFVTETDDYMKHTIFGINDVAVSGMGAVSNDFVKKFYLNRYNGIGVIIPFEFEMDACDDDIIFREDFALRSDATLQWEHLIFTEKYAAVDGKFKIKFNLLVTHDYEYDLRVIFRSNCGNIYIKRVKFNVIDIRRSLLSIYKIMPNLDNKEYHNNDFMFKHYNGYSDGFPYILPVVFSTYYTYHKYFIPYNPNIDENYGVKLKQLISIYGKYMINSKFESLDGLVDTALRQLPLDDNTITAQKIYNAKGLPAGITQHDRDLIMGITIYLSYPENSKLTRSWVYLCKYYTRYRKEKFVQDASGEWKPTDGLPSFYTFIADSFATRDGCTLPFPNNIINDLEQYFLKIYNIKHVLVRNELVYIPFDHHLEPLNRETIEGLTINEDETLCVIPDIKYLKRITEHEWVFHNASTGHDYIMPTIKEPFVASKDPNYPILDPGYYDIIFRYKLATNADTIHEICLKSAFIQRA